MRSRCSAAAVPHEADLVPNANGTGRGRRLAALPPAAVRAPASTRRLSAARRRRSRRRRPFRHPCGQTRALSLPPVLHESTRGSATTRPLPRHRPLGRGQQERKSKAERRRAGERARPPPPHQPQRRRQERRARPLARAWAAAHAARAARRRLRVGDAAAAGHGVHAPLPAARRVAVKSPTLYTDYIGGDDGTACIPPRTAREPRRVRRRQLGLHEQERRERLLCALVLARLVRGHEAAAVQEAEPEASRRRARPGQAPGSALATVSAASSAGWAMMHRAVRVAALPRLEELVRGSRPKETVRAQLAEAAASNEAMEVRWCTLSTASPRGSTSTCIRMGWACGGKDYCSRIGFVSRAGAGRRPRDRILTLGTLGR